MPMIEYKWIPAKSFRKGRSLPINGIVLHSSDGHLEGDIETLTQGPVSSHWYIAKDGSIYHFVQDSDTAYHAGKAIKGWGNVSTIGIEQEHMDGEEPWPEEQIHAMAHLIVALRQKHGPLDAKSHAEIAVPKGRKVDPVAYPWDDLHDEVINSMELIWDFQQI